MPSSHYPFRPEPIDDASNKALRLATKDLMVCKHCKGRLLIGQSGLICEGGCGGIVPTVQVQTPDGFMFPRLSQLRRAWPELAIHAKED